MPDTTDRAYSDAYDEALSYAARVHAHQWRKVDEREAPSLPYIAHLLEVSALVWQGGGTEAQAIAGLLHDALEDQLDRTSPEEIAHKFGHDVRRIVESCSDGVAGLRRDEHDWLGRKVAYLTHLYDPDVQDALLVTVADKVSNARAILDDLTTAGASPERQAALWNRFNAPPQAIAWYYVEVLTAVSASLPDNTLVVRLGDLVPRLVGAAGGADLRAAYPERSDTDLDDALASLVAATTARH